MKRSTFVFALGILFVLMLGIGGASAEVNAPTTIFTVNDDGDDGDATPGNGVCETANGNGICTLRAAIMEADWHSGSDIIEFDSSINMIMPDSGYPPMSDTSPTIIRDLDGTKVIIWGTNAGANATCFEISASGYKIQGLHIAAFDGNAIYVSGGVDIVIGTDGDGVDDDLEGNYILSSGDYGIYVLGGSNMRISGNTIGLKSAPNETGIYIYSGIGNLIGTDGDGVSDDLERNIISGNDYRGIDIRTNGNTIAGNYIGTNDDGDEAVPNGWDGIRIQNSADENVIGTNGDGNGDAAEMNLISGNGKRGIYFDGGGTDNNIIAGNYIGTDISGTSVISNTEEGIQISGSYNRIGTDGDGVSDTLERNLVSGNGHNGISVGGDYNVVAGNYVGTDASGTSALPNEFSGISISGTYSTVGTDADGQNDSLERNLVSGNIQSGIRVTGERHTVAGNYVGTTASGSSSLGNEGPGIMLIGSTQVTIGGTQLNTKNVISGNLGGGLKIGVDQTFGGNTKAMVYGNLIGTTATGSAALPNSGSGIYILGSDSSMIGGSSSSYRNIISCNSTGILIEDSIYGVAPVNNVIKGNYIGVFRNGTSPCGGSGVGIYMSDPSVDSTTIGGVDSGDGNIIANFAQDGIRVHYNGSIENAIRGNSIYNNGEEGIDLTDSWNNGVTPNDGDDSDTGPNNYQNYPVLESAILDGTDLMIQGTLTSTASTKFQVDFFINSVCDPSGYGEGENYLKQLGMMTSAGGVVQFNTTVSGPIPAGMYITATATDPDGNTSEFSACMPVTYRVYLPLVIR